MLGSAAWGNAAWPCMPMHKMLPKFHTASRQTVLCYVPDSLASRPVQPRVAQHGYLHTQPCCPPTKTPRTLPTNFWPKRWVLMVEKPE